MIDFIPYLIGYLLGCVTVLAGANAFAIWVQHKLQESSRCFEFGLGKIEEARKMRDTAFRYRLHAESALAEVVRREREIIESLNEKKAPPTDQG